MTRVSLDGRRGGERIAGPPSVLLDDKSLIIRFKNQSVGVITLEGANQRKFQDAVEFGRDLLSPHTAKS